MRSAWDRTKPELLTRALRSQSAVFHPAAVQAWFAREAPWVDPLWVEGTLEAGTVNTRLDATFRRRATWCSVAATARSSAMTPFGTDGGRASAGRSMQGSSRGGGWGDGPCRRKLRTRSGAPPEAGARLESRGRGGGLGSLVSRRGVGGARLDPLGRCHLYVLQHQEGNAARHRCAERLVRQGRDRALVESGRAARASGAGGSRRRHGSGGTAGGCWSEGGCGRAGSGRSRGGDRAGGSSGGRRQPRATGSCGEPGSTGSHGTGWSGWAAGSRGPSRTGGAHGLRRLRPHADHALR